MYDAFRNQLPDSDSDETNEWIEALDQVIDSTSSARARYLMTRLLFHARLRNIGLPAQVSTDYINTISPDEEPYFPGNEEVEHKIRRIIRWNAAAMVSRANKELDGIGGHLSTYASAASLYEVGFNHFFRGREHQGGGDHIFFQGHAAPGIYARSFLEGRFDEAKLDNFRREALTPGLSSYPHPRLMPEYWEFPTVSMGLSPSNAIYQARFNRYLQHRGIKDTSQQRVWCYLGDGEMDEPESMAALSLAAREGLDNLIFVVNCNLQRLDGPVRGNGKVIQEFERIFRGAGWHVIKAIWGREWDPLIENDADGVLLHKMNTTVDGEFQKYVVESGEYIRDHFFGPDPRLKKLVEHLSDEELKKLRRGGHDYRKVYAAYAGAVELKDAPVVILAKTVKGWTLGGAIEGRNVTHQAKKLSEEELMKFRDTLELPIKDEDLAEGRPPYYHPGEDSEEVMYLKEQRQKARRLPSLAQAERDQRRASQASSLRRVQGRVKGTTGGHDDGVRSVAAKADAGQGHRASASCPSFPTRPARSVWSRCSPSSRSMRRSARPTNRSTPSTCSRTARRPRDRYSKRASRRPVRWARSSRPEPPTRVTASR